MSADICSYITDAGVHKSCTRQDVLSKYQSRTSDTQNQQRPCIQETCFESTSTVNESKHCHTKAAMSPALNATHRICDSRVPSLAWPAEFSVQQFQHRLTVAARWRAHAEKRIDFHGRLPSTLDAYWLSCGPCATWSRRHTALLQNHGYYEGLQLNIT